MKRLTTKATIYLLLALIGLAFTSYSFKIKNNLMLIASVLFAIVSADNIFCNLRDEQKLSVKN